MCSFRRELTQDRNRPFSVYGTDATWALFACLNPLTEEKRTSFDDVHYNGSYIGLALSRGHARAEESLSKNALLINHKGRKQKSHSY